MYRVWGKGGRLEGAMNVGYLVSQGPSRREETSSSLSERENFMHGTGYINDRRAESQKRGR